MTSDYDDVQCLKDERVACRHADCLNARDAEAVCGNVGIPERLEGFEFTNRRKCLLPLGHDGMWHRHTIHKWRVEHTCPELLIVNEQLVRDLQKVLDDLGDTIETGRSKFDAIRLILDKMEKGFRIP